MSRGFQRGTNGLTRTTFALLFLVAVLAWAFSADYWYSPLVSLSSRNRLWLTRHAALFAASDAGKGLPWLANVSFANRGGTEVELGLDEGAEGQGPSVCVGVMVYGRTVPYLLGLIDSLVRGAAGANLTPKASHTKGAASKTSTARRGWNPGFSLTVYWQPASQQDGDASFIKTAVADMGVDVVRVDQAILAQRHAAAEDGFGHCPTQSVSKAEEDERAEQKMWALAEGATVGNVSSGNFQRRRMVLGGHLYGHVLLDMVQRQGNAHCGSYLVLEDDVIASRGWLKAVHALVIALNAMDPAWRVVKLFSPDLWTSWTGNSPSIWVVWLVLTGCTLALLAAWTWAWRGKEGQRGDAWSLPSGHPLLRSSSITSRVLINGCIRSCMRIIAASGGPRKVLTVAGVFGLICGALFLVGRPRLPCILNGLACSGMRGPLQGHWPQVCTQAFLFSKGAAGSFGACLATTPIGMTCLASDSATHRCFATPPGGGSRQFDDYQRQAACTWELDSEGNRDRMTCKPPLPCPAKWEQCEPAADDLYGLYESLPHLFQHVGTTNSFGEERPLLSSDRWAGYSEGPLTPWHLWPIAGPRWPF